MLEVECQRVFGGESTDIRVSVLPYGSSRHCLRLGSSSTLCCGFFVMEEGGGHTLQKHDDMK